MHINVHIAVGVITTSLFHYFFNFTIIEFIFIVFCSFICDFDVFFSKFAKDHNHRLLITHSIIPSILMIIIGYLLKWSALIFGGFAYSIHIVIDTFDWGTNFFYFDKKQVGFKLLISEEELENLPNYLNKYKNHASFFDEKYFTNKSCITIEIVIFIIMIVFNILFALQHIYMVLIYFLGLYFHLHRHFSLKKIEKEQQMN
ncbi:MAG: metal-dependent hydrolase [Promethearchaeota archaeon]|nr:MAG: metal-dependent hydrolase [Candidatus Lokiarchaeota archaeon]